MSEIDVRPAMPGDLPALTALYAQLNPEDPPLAADEAERIWSAFHCYPGSAILVGIRNMVPVATCTLAVVPNLTRGGASYGLIENVVTDARHRRRGYGRVLLEAAMARAWSHGCYKVMLLTGSRNPDTLRFYRNAGFAQDKTGFQARRPAG